MLEPFKQFYNTNRRKRTHLWNCEFLFEFCELFDSTQFWVSMYVSKSLLKLPMWMQCWYIGNWCIYTEQNPGYLFSESDATVEQHLEFFIKCRLMYTFHFAFFVALFYLYVCSNIFLFVGLPLVPKTTIHKERQKRRLLDSNMCQIMSWRNIWWLI